MQFHMQFYASRSRFCNSNYKTRYLTNLHVNACSYLGPQLVVGHFYLPVISDLGLGKWKSKYYYRELVVISSCCCLSS